MASRQDKTSYDALLRDARALTDDLDLTQEEDYSLEEILAEYGGGRERKILADVERAVAGEPESAPKPEPPPQPESKPEAKAEIKPTPPADAGETRRFPIPEAAKPAPEPEPEPPAEKPGSKVRLFRPPREDPVPEEPKKDSPFPPPPQPISMEEVVQRTVAAVMEEEGEPELLPEKRRRRGLFSRRPMEDTESIYTPKPEDEEPEEEDEAEAIGPEPDLEDVAAAYRQAYQRQKAPLGWALLFSLVPIALRVAEDRGFSIPFWSTDSLIRNGAELGILLLVMLLCRSVIAKGFRLLGRKRFSGELMLSLSALVCLADGVSRFFLPERTGADGYAAVACLGLTAALWGCARESRGWYDTCRTAALTERPPYLVTDTPQGACKQRGSLPGFYTAAAKDDLPLLWSTAILPVIFVGTAVFAGLSSFGQGRGQDFPLCWSAILAAAASFALPLAFPLPFSSLAKQLQREGCAVAG